MFATSASLIRAAFLVAIVLAAGFARADVQYAYNAAGRLVQVIEPDGSSAAYQYDSVGNIVGIQRLATGQLALVDLSKSGGNTGTQVTIQGSGFSTTPGNDIVSFNGVDATVVSATPNQLVVQVPAGSSTGYVSVTVAGNGTVTSSQSFAVQAGPTISGFSPAVADVGSTVVLSGSNLAVPGAQVKVGTSAAILASVAQSQMTIIPSASASGHVVVTTPYGDATSTDPLVVVPSSIGASNVLASAILQGNGSPQSLSIGQETKYGIFAFDANQGQFLTLQLSALTTAPANQSVSYEILSPSGVLISSGSVSSSAMSIDMPQTPAAGTYLVAFTSSNATIQLTATLEINATFGATGSLSGITTLAGQTKRFVIAASAGQNLGIGVTGLTFAPSTLTWGTVTLFDPTGKSLWARTCYSTDPGGGCDLQFTNLALSGNYVLTVVPGGYGPMSFNLTTSQAITNTLVLSSPQTVNMAVPGQYAILTFTVSAGQTLAVNVDSVALTPSSAPVFVAINSPSGQTLWTQTTTGSVTFNLANATAGTYEMFVASYYAATGSLQVTLAPGVVGSPPVDGSTNNFSTGAQGESATFTIAGTAGENLGVGLTNLVMTPNGAGYVTVNFYDPNGNYIWGRQCYTSSPNGDCGLEYGNLSMTGNYTLTVTPGGQSTMSFGLTLSQAITASLPQSSPQTATISLPGQYEIYSFTATAGETLAVNINSITTSPANQPLYISINNPSGQSVWTQSGSGSMTYNLSNATAGTYTVWVVPYYGLTGSAQVTLAPGVVGSPPVDGSTNNFSTGAQGEIATFTIAETAGENLGVGLTNLVMTPNDTGYVTVNFYDPNGSYIWGRQCYTSSPNGDCGLEYGNLSMTGNYTLTVTPGGQSTMSFGLTLSQAITASLPQNSPQTATISLPGQFEIYSFTATAGESLTVTINSITTSPANQPLYISINNPSGQSVWTQSGSGSMSYNLSNATAGTYTVWVIPYYGLTASAQVTLQ